MFGGVMSVPMSIINVVLLKTMTNAHSTENDAFD